MALRHSVQLTCIFPAGWGQATIPLKNSHAVSSQLSTRRGQTLSVLYDDQYPISMFAI